MAVQFKPKAGKPHIKIMLYFNGYALGRTNLGTKLDEKSLAYVSRVNPKSYKTPGEAARALHYGSAK